VASNTLSIWFIFSLCDESAIVNIYPLTAVKGFYSVANAEKTYHCSPQRFKEFSWVRHPCHGALDLISDRFA